MTTINLSDKELHKKFKMYCLKHEVSAKKVIEEHMRHLVQQDECNPQNVN